MKTKLLFSGIILSVLVVSAYAAESRPSVAYGAANNEQMRKMQEQMAQQQAEMKKQEAQQKEVLKQQDPKMYEQLMAQQKIQGEIDQIVSDFQAKKVSEGQAKSKLRPLVKEQTPRIFRKIKTQSR